MTLPSASLLESAQFNQLVIVPNALQGLFRRRPTAVALATRTGVDGQAVKLMARIRRSHGDGPVWVRVMRDRALLVLNGEDAAHVLDGSPHPFASDPPAKRNGMRAFQPDALTITRGSLWEDRRRFTDAVLARPGARPANVAREEMNGLLTDRQFGYDRWQEVFGRITRRIVLGDAAADDDALSDELGEMMSEANGMPGEPSERLPAFMERVQAYVDRAQRGSFVARFANAPQTVDTKPAGQVSHWMFATNDTLATNALRALALIASHPHADTSDLRACLSEAMRLYPTTPLLSRETVAELTWRGEVVPAGTQVLIPNTFLHRDRERIEYADRFAPEEWTSGDAASNPAFNFFSRGPQGCPGAQIALTIGAAALEELLSARRVLLLEPRLDPARPLPHMLDPFRLRFALEER